MYDFPGAPAPRPKRSEQRKAQRKLGRRGRAETPAQGAAPTAYGVPAVRADQAPPQPAKHWKKRVIIGSASLFVILVLIVGGVFFYAKWRFDQIHREKVAGLATPAPGQPFNILLVGSDSRQFVGDNSGEAGAFGSASSVGGQRSDVIIVARIVPATHQIKLLSIPVTPGSTFPAAPMKLAKTASTPLTARGRACWCRQLPTTSIFRSATTPR